MCFVESGRDMQLCSKKLLTVLLAALFKIDLTVPSENFQKIISQDCDSGLLCQLIPINGHMSPKGPPKLEVIDAGI